MDLLSYILISNLSFSSIQTNYSPEQFQTIKHAGVEISLIRPKNAEFDLNSVCYLQKSDKKLYKGCLKAAQAYFDKGCQLPSVKQKPKILKMYCDASRNFYKMSK